jgi:hypothetical protein
MPSVWTFRCEATFSKLASTKAKQRSVFDPEADMLVRLPNMTPDFRNLWKASAATSLVSARFNGESKIKG